MDEIIAEEETWQFLCRQGVQLTLCVEYVRLKRFPETMHDLRLLSLTAHCVVLFYISGKNTLTTNKLFICRARS